MEFLRIQRVLSRGEGTTGDGGGGVSLVSNEKLWGSVSFSEKLKIIPFGVNDCGKRRVTIGRVMRKLRVQKS